MKEGRNEVILLGNLGEEPVFHYGKNGIAVANLRIATVETVNVMGGKKKKNTEWHSVVAFDRIAEACNTYLKKGSRVKVEGRLHSRRLTYKSGLFSVVTTIIAEDVEFLNDNDLALKNLFGNKLREGHYE